MKALVLAGGYPQVALIKRLKSAGIFVILADWSRQPVAEKYADKFYRESTLDIPAIEAIAIKETVDLIITVCTDQALNTVATVSERLGLPCYIDAITGRNVTNKLYMKQIFIHNGIPTAPFFVVKSGEVIPSDLVFPLVVKPVDCNSSKGVVKVNEAAELDNAIKTAQEYSRTNDAIIEEYIEGDEFSVDAIVENGISTILCISEVQKFGDGDKFIICRTNLPSYKVTTNIKNKAERLVQLIASAFSLKNCPMLVQILCRKNELYIVEFSARTGGGEKYRTIEYYSGVDIIQSTINMTLGNYKPVIPSPCSDHICNEFIYCRKGVVDRFVGFEEAKQKSLIFEYELYRQPGEYIEEAMSSGDRAAMITFVGNSYSDIIMKYHEAMSMIMVVDNLGDDIMRRDILLS